MRIVLIYLNDETKRLIWMLMTLLAMNVTARAAASPVDSAVSGTTTGLTGTLVLSEQNNRVLQSVTGSQGSIKFSFPQKVPAGSVYSVSIRKQPVDQTCMVSNGTGKMGSNGLAKPISINCVTDCPTAPEVEATGLVVSPVSGTDSEEFKALVAKAVIAINAAEPPPPHALPHTLSNTAQEKSISPSDGATLLLGQAESELESAALDTLVQDLCGKPQRRAYFPNTCASIPAATPGNYPASAAQMDTLLSNLKLDIKAFPACTILLHSPSKSKYGYFVTSLLEQVIKADQTHNFPDLLHGLATNAKLSSECTDAASPATGCRLYLAAVAADATLITQKNNNVSSLEDLFGDAGNAKKAQAVALDAAGAALVDLTAAMCPNRSDKTELCPSNVFFTAAVNFLGIQKGNLDSQSATWTQELTPFVAFIDQAKDIDSSIKQIEQIKKTKSPLSDANKAKVQQLEISVLADSAGLIANSLPELLKFQLPERATATPAWVEQTAVVVPAVANAYVDFQSKDYLGAVKSLQSIPKVKCLTPANTGSDCGLLFSSPSSDFGSLLEVLALTAEAADATDTTSLKAILAGPSGADAWKAKFTTREWWVGGYVGVQGGWEHLYAPGHSANGADYGVFAPIGVGINWPNVFAKRPVDVYVSAFDVGNLISLSTATTPGSGTNNKTQTGWSQLLSPGLFVTTPIWKAVYVGLGYVYRTPNLRSLPTAPGTQVSANSNRVELFIAVDATLHAFGD